jgi:hypothetical protein
MEAYEFFAMPENGTIVIPKQYRTKITSEVKVILLEKSPRKATGRKAKTTKKSDMLLAPTAKTIGWKFDREEANAR